MQNGHILVYKNTHPHVDHIIKDLIPTYGWEQLEHHPYCPHLLTFGLTLKEPLWWSAL